MRSFPIPQNPLTHVRRFFLSVLLIPVVFFAVAAVVHAEPPEAAKGKVIRELLELTDSADLGLQFAQIMQQQFAYLYPAVPQKTWQDWMAELDTSEVNAKILAVYDQNFTLDELTGLLAFYKTPAGKANLKKMPIVSQQAMEATQQWTKEEAAKMQERLQKQGYQPIQQ